MRHIILFCLALASTSLMTFSLTSTPALAQRAIEGATAHPAVPLPPGGYITRDEFTDFAILDFPAGRLVRGEDQERLVVEGAHTRKEYTIDGLETASLRLYRTYLQHFENQGFEILFSGMGEELTDRRPLDFLTRSEIAAQPSGSSEPAYILARNAAEDQVIAFTIYERQRNRRMMVNVVDIEKLATLELMPVETAPEPEPEAVVEAEPEALPLQNAAELESGLVADGRVVVNAILFEVDRAEILPESAEALATVAALMQDRAGLSLLVVGHTDGVGSFDYNLRLSVERATAVVDWLRTRHGIAADRLRPAGAGPMSPITTNRTEEGRALNRRVELVEVID